MTDEALPAKVDATPSPKKQSGIRDPRMVRIGGAIAVVGLVASGIVNAVIGMEQYGTQPFAETKLRPLALTILLSGFTVMLYGIMRFEKINARLAAFNTQMSNAAATKNHLSLVVGFVMALFVVVTLMTVILLIGLPLLAFVIVVCVPAPMFLLALYSPQSVRPFFVSALFPAVVLLVVDCMLMGVLLVDGLYFFQSQRAVGFLVINVFGMLMIPVFGAAGLRFANWLRSLEEKPKE